MSLNIDTLQVVEAPSFFKIELNNIKDKSGNVVDLSQTGLVFLFTDNYGKFYKCVYNPFDETQNSNIAYDSESGKLTLLFQDYQLRDRLKLKICSFTTDADFNDNVWKSYDAFTQIKISIKWS